MLTNAHRVSHRAPSQNSSHSAEFSEKKTVKFQWHCCQISRNRRSISRTRESDGEGKEGKRVSRKSSYGKQSNSFVYLASCANMDLAYAVPVRHQKKNSKQSFNKFIFYDRSRFFLNRSILRGGQKFNISPVFMADRYNTFFLVM